MTSAIGKVKPQLVQGERYFVWIALGWLAMGQMLCLLTSKDPVNSGLWCFLMWFLSLLDLWVLRKVVQSMFLWMDAALEVRWVHAVQTMFWGFFKLVCLGLFILVLLKGIRIPMHGLILGMGTLGVVPLFGGLLWSQRVLRNA